jgi:hypothetical protein
MCEKLKPYNLEKINYIKQKLLNNKNDNPSLVIENIKYKNKTFNLIQEGYLIAGTKQRVVVLFIKKILKKNKDINTLVYSGTSNGFGSVATAYVAYKLNLKSLVFISGDNNDTRQINTLHALNSNIYLCKDYNNAKKLKYKMTDENGKTKKDFYLVPMGFNDTDEIMINILSKQIKKASKNTILDNKQQKRFWLVAGSGGIVMSLNKVFPNSKFFIYLTGAGRHKKKIIDWAKLHKNIHILKPEQLNIDYVFSTVKNYDDYIWHYIKKYGKEGDYIWNVASDDYIIN